VREYLAEEMTVVGTVAAPELPVNHTNLVVSLDKRVLSLYRLETARRVVDDVDVEVVVVILTEPEVARADYRNGQAELTLEWDQVQWARPRVTFDALLSAVLTSLWDSLSGGIFANARPPGQAWDVQDPRGLRRRLRRHRVAGVPGMFCTLFFLSLVLKMVFI
jgi:hypothetical protein